MHSFHSFAPFFSKIWRILFRSGYSKNVGIGVLYRNEISLKGVFINWWIGLPFFDCLLVKLLNDQHSITATHASLSHRRRSARSIYEFAKNCKRTIVTSDGDARRTSRCKLTTFVRCRYRHQSGLKNNATTIAVVVVVVVVRRSHAEGILLLCLCVSAASKTTLVYVKVSFVCAQNAAAPVKRQMCAHTLPLSPPSRPLP